MAKWSWVSEKMGCNESFRAHGSTELEVLLHFLNQITLLSETDQLLRLNKCLTNTWAKQHWKITQTHRDSWTFHLRIRDLQFSKKNRICHLNSLTDILEYNRSIVFDFEFIVGLKPCHLSTIFILCNIHLHFSLYIFQVLFLVFSSIKPGISFMLYSAHCAAAQHNNALGTSKYAICKQHHLSHFAYSRAARQIINSGTH